MNALLNLLGNLLLTTASSLGPQTPTSTEALFARNDAATADAGASTQRRQARAARISLADPYYSFSRVKRAHKD